MKFRLPCNAFASLLFGFHHLGASASEAELQPDVAFDVDKLVFRADSNSPDGRGHELRIVGQSGFFADLEFDANETPSFSLRDFRENLSDGLYKFELRERPKKKDRQLDRSDTERENNVMYGSFTIKDGAAVDQEVQEEEGGNGEEVSTSLKKYTRGTSHHGRALDQQILDDLIVQGSACIGLDCNIGESFGFDTIRLKENNLRIKFQDTSSTASFPTNDWQITINDSSNGGQNKFSIDDIDGSRTPLTIEASAPSHSLYVDNGGRVGFGTSTLITDLHVKSGNTPTLRLEQDGSSGFTAQTWDLAGNEASFFVRDATSGSTLPFRIYPGAPSNALTIEGSTGDIGMGTTSPEARLHIVDSQPNIKLSSSGSSVWELGLQSSGDDFIIKKDDTEYFKIDANGACTCGSESSEKHGIISSGFQNALSITFPPGEEYVNENYLVFITVIQTSTSGNNRGDIRANAKDLTVNGFTALLERTSEIQAVHWMTKHLG